MLNLSFKDKIVICTTLVVLPIIISAVLGQMIGIIPTITISYLVGILLLILYFVKTREPRPSDSPPWIFGTKEGALRIDESDERYQKFFKDTVEYYAQWKIVDGKLERKSNHIKTKPNWRDYV